MRASPRARASLGARGARGRRAVTRARARVVARATPRDAARDDAAALETALEAACDGDDGDDARVARVASRAGAIGARDVGARIVARARAAIEDGRARAGGADGRAAKAAAAKARGDAATRFNAAISAFNRAGMSMACEALMEMMGEVAAPDVVTYALCASASAREGRTREAAATLERASEALRRGTRQNRKKKKRKSGDACPMMVLWDDGAIAAVAKPVGVLTHPVEGGGKDATLMDAALSRFDDALSDLNGSDKRGIVSRLDKPTSGVMLLAKTNAAHAELLTQFYQRTVVKTYWALVDGAPPERRGTESASLDGRPATSEYEVMETFVGPSWSYSLVRVEPKSGRKHQIRRHMALLGAPLVGDPLYRSARTKQINPNPPECVLKALSVGKPGTIFWLHAGAVEFSTLIGERIVVSAPLPSAFETLLTSLRVRACALNE